MVVVVAVMSASVLMVFKEKKLNEKKSKKTKCEVEEDDILNLGGNESKVTIIYLVLSMRHT